MNYACAKNKGQQVRLNQSQALSIVLVTVCLFGTFARYKEAVRVVPPFNFQRKYLEIFSKLQLTFKSFPVSSFAVLITLTARRLG